MGIRPFELVVAGTDPRASHLERTKGLSVPRQLFVVVVGDFDFNSPDRGADGGSKLSEIVLAIQLSMRSRRVTRPQRAHLGHPPGVAGVDAVGVKLFHD